MLKKSLLLAAAVVAVSATGVANAQTYVGVSAGVTAPNDSKNKGAFTSTVAATTAASPIPLNPAPPYTAIPSGTSLAWTTEFDKGYNLSGVVGHRFEGGFRVEGELNYSSAGVKRHSGVTAGGGNIDNIDAAVLTRGPQLVGATVGQVVDSGIGKQSSFGVFGNAYYDFNSGGSFQPYVGAGIGIQRTKFDYRPSNINVGKGKETNFAWQLMAGATYKISPSLEVFGQYNYRDAGKTTLKLNLVPADLDAQSKQSIFSLGFRVPFGGQ
jgi:opacity protein-like surface antigen